MPASLVTSSPAYLVTACASTCAPNTVFVSSTAGCAPPTAINGPVDSLGLYYSGSQAEGFAAFSAASSTAGISYTTDRFGVANAAMALSGSTHLDTATNIPGLPIGNAAMSLSAWVQCAPFTSTGQASVVEWGTPALATALSKLSLSVLGSSTPSVPGPVNAAVCDSKWHHLAVVQGDFNATTMKQYVDGTLVASSTSTTLAVPALASSSLRVGWNGGPPTASFTAVGTTTWTVPAGVTQPRKSP